MKPNTSRNTFRLHIPTGHDLRDLGLGVAAIVAAGAFWGAAGNGLLTGDRPTATAAAPAADADCDLVQDQFSRSDRPEETVESTFTEAGLVSRGSWISFDGLTWEHIDGRVVVVAHPRRATPAQDAGCDADTNDEASRA